MQFVVGLFLVLALAVIGCGETSDAGGGVGGSGGTGGTGAYAGNCGYPNGMAGGAAFYAPGLWQNTPSDESRACFYMNDSCTGLVASPRCNITEDGREPHFIEISWVDGRNERDEPCAAHVRVTEDVVEAVPVTIFGFQVSFTDSEGARWRIDGEFVSSEAFLNARREEGDTFCEITEYPGLWVYPWGR